MLMHRMRWFLTIVALVVAISPFSAILAQDATPIAPAAAPQASPVASPVPPAATAPGFTVAPCPFPLPATIVDGTDVSCGYLAVPERHEAPDGTLIQLAVAILAPVGGAATSAPLVLLNGGPGQDSALLISAFGIPEFPAYQLRQNRQVILFDQRGVGASVPSLACPELAQADLTSQPLTADEQGAVMTELANQCRDRLIAEGVDLAAYTSAQSAADVAALRTALGFDQVDLYGGSYGTRLALTVLRDHPDGIRSVILDANYPPQRDLYADAPATFNTALQGVFEGCAADPACAQANPDLPGALERTVRTLDASPQALTVPIAGTDQTIDLTLNGLTFVNSVVFTSLYATPLIPYLPYLITLASQGQYDLTVQFLSVLLTNPPLSYGMYYSIQCSEEVPFSAQTAPATPSAQPPALLPTIAEKFQVDSSIMDVCGGWPIDPPNPVENQPVTSDVPALIVDGQFDPITSPDNAALVAQGLPNSTVAIFPGAGHTLIDQPCAVGVFIAFLADPATAPDLACTAEMGADFSPEG